MNEKKKRVGVVCLCCVVFTDEEVLCVCLVAKLLVTVNLG